MVDSTPQRGSWWLSGQGRRRVAGTLIPDQPGAAALSLELDGPVLPSARMPHDGLLGDLPAVLGRTTDNTDVTLCGTHHVGRRQVGFGNGAKIVDTVSARFGLLGGLFPDGEATVFSSYTFRTSHLADWVLVDSVLTNHSQEVDEQGFALSWSVRVPSSIDLTLPWGTLSLNFGMGYTDGREQATINRPVSWRMQLNTAQTIDIVTDEYLWPLEQFLAFACDGYVTVEGLTAEFVRRGHTRSRQVSVLRPERPQSTNARSPRGPFDMLFTLPAVGERLGPLLASWYVHFERLKSSLNLLFGLVMGPNMFLESRFLLVAQAIEVFHRLQFGGNREPKEQWKARKARIFDAVTSHEVARGDLGWITSALEWSNELTLNDRVEELLGRVSATSTQFLRQDFLRTFKATRNYYTHFDPRQLRHAAQGQNLYWLTEECFALMQALLLDLLGISPDEAWAWLRRTPRVQNLLRLRSEQRPAPGLP